LGKKKGGKTEQTKARPRNHVTRNQLGSECDIISGGGGEVEKGLTVEKEEAGGNTMWGKKQKKNFRLCGVRAPFTSCRPAESFLSPK